MSSENKEIEVGFFEALENGVVVRSWTRIASTVMLIVSVLFLGYSTFNYYQIIGKAIELAQSNPTFEPSMLAMVQTLKIVDLGLFALLLLSWIAPKSIAKYAENNIK